MLARWMYSAVVSVAVMSSMTSQCLRLFSSSSPSPSSPSHVKHVVFMHGLLSDAGEWQHFTDLIERHHPGTPVTAVSAFSNEDSLAPMWTQARQIANILRPLLTNSSLQTLAVCYSQGGLVCRGVLSLLPHNVHTLVVLSSPLAGEFGDTKEFFPFGNKFFRDNLYEVMYTPLGQDISIGGYWNDPRHQEAYRKWSRYLAVLNNVSDSAHVDRSREYKENFLRINRLVLVGGPDDEVITPWQSSQFGFYDSSLAVRPMQEQEWYKNDAFGLRTLDESGAVVTFTFPGLKHNDWHLNNTVFEKCILPWLS